MSAPAGKVDPSPIKIIAPIFSLLSAEISASTKPFRTAKPKLLTGGLLKDIIA